MKRVFWALVGIGLGAVVGAQAVRWAAKTKQRYAPPALARQAGRRAVGLKDRLADAIAAGAEEMVQREAELRADLGIPPR